jgi:hypothetical protein
MLIEGCDFHTRYQPFFAPSCPRRNRSPRLLSAPHVTRSFRLSEF